MKGTIRFKKPLTPQAAASSPNPSQPLSSDIPKLKAVPDKLQYMFDVLKEFQWSLGDFMNYALRTVDQEKKRVSYTRQHLGIVTNFLSGRTNVKPVDVVDLLYKNPYGVPKSKVDSNLAEKYARPTLTSWATEITIQKMTKEAKLLVRDPELRIRATQKSHGAVQEVTQSQSQASLPTAMETTDAAAVNEPLEAGDRLFVELGSTGERIVREMHGGPIDIGATAEVDEQEEMESDDDEEEEEEEEALGGDFGEDASDQDVQPEPESAQPLRTDSESRKHSSTKRGKAADTLISWDIIEKFSIASLADKYQRGAPTIWRVLDSLMDGGKRKSKGGGSYRPKEIVSTGVLSEILYARNQFCNLFPICRSIANFAMRTHQSVFRLGSRMAQCAPFSTTRNALVTMAREKSQWLRDNPERNHYWPVLDNVQQFARRRDHHIGTANEMITGTGATAVVMEDCPEDAFDAQPYVDNLEKRERNDLTVDKILEKVDLAHLQLVSELHFLDIVVQHVPSLAPYRSGVTDLLKHELKKHQINATRQTKVHPLGTNDANEVSMKGMKEALTDIIDQLGITDESLKAKVQLISGDGKSFQMIGDLKKVISDQPTADKSLLMLVEILELWHTKYTDLIRNISCKSGDKDSAADPSGFRFVAQLVNIPIPSNLSNVEFYPGAKLLDITVRAHVLRAWEVHLGTDDIVSYFNDLKDKKRLPTPGELRGIAWKLSSEYGTTEAYERALYSGDGFKRGNNTSDLGEHALNSNPVPPATVSATSSELPKQGEVDAAERAQMSSTPMVEPTAGPSQQAGVAGRKSGPEPQVENKAGSGDLFKGDWPLANSIMMIRDGIWFLEYCRAVSSGDTGRVWEILKAWLFTFAGGGHTNYTNYLLEMFCKVEYEFPASLITALFNNWLVNLSGKKDGFIELDLMQEHFNLWLEELAKYKGKEFSDPWYRLVISMHVHHFLRLKEEMEKMVALVPRRKGHTEPHLDNEFREVLRAFRERDIHRFHSGRDLGLHSPDHFAEGVMELRKGKIASFLQSSMQGRQGLDVVQEISGASVGRDPTTALYHPLLYKENGEPYLPEQIFPLDNQ